MTGGVPETELRALCSELEMEAFLTGSRIRGTHDESSDLDLIIIDERGESIEKPLQRRLNDLVDTSFEIDVRVFPRQELLNRLQQGDPFVHTLLIKMRPLTLAEETKEELENHSEIERSQSSEFITQVIEDNLYSAALALVEAIIYLGYRELMSHQDEVVVPRKLGTEIESFNPYLGGLVKRATAYRRNLSARDCSPEEVLSNLLPEMDRVFEECY